MSVIKGFGAAKASSRTIRALIPHVLGNGQELRSGRAHDKGTRHNSVSLLVISLRIFHCLECLTVPHDGSAKYLHIEPFA